MAVQTAKGWVFVAGSALLIFGLMSRRERELRRKHDQLERALQQVSILHRVVRHNLRNTCNVIRGHAESLTDDADRVAAIKRQTDDLLDIGEKSRHLRDIALRETPRRKSVDLSDLVRRRVETVRAAHPDATVETDLPDEARVEVVSRFGVAVAELLENAIEHTDRVSPTVWVTVETDADGTVTVDVADDGPGLPEMERELLEASVERPLFHSQGLGLWLARIMVTESGGSLRVMDNEPRGTVVRMTLDDETPTEVERAGSSVVA
ncbi:MAG: sensor histidine kinase [Haloplanus sp.]